MPTERDMPELDNVSIAEAALKLEQGTTSEWNAIYEAAKGTYRAEPKNGKSVLGYSGCNPSVVETIAAEFIDIQDTEEEEANNFLTMVKLAYEENNLFALNKKLEE